MSLSQPPRGVASVPFEDRAAPRRRLRRVALLAVSVAVGVWLWQWVSTDDEGLPIAEQSDEPSLRIENLQSFLVRRGGLPLWQISARHVEVSADRQSTVAKGVRNGTFFREGKPFLKVNAAQLKLTNPTNDVEASGGVEASGPDGFSFKTVRALWRNRAQIIECPKPVIATLRGMVFETSRLRYNWEKGVLTCPDPVEVRAPGAVFRGRNLEASVKNRQVKLSGGVELIFDPKAAKIPEVR